MWGVVVDFMVHLSWLIFFDSQCIRSTSCSQLHSNFCNVMTEGASNFLRRILWRAFWKLTMLSVQIANKIGDKTELLRLRPVAILNICDELMSHLTQAEQSMWRPTVVIDFVNYYYVQYFWDTDNETVRSTWNDLQMSLKIRLRSLEMAQFNMPHVTFYWWSVVTMCLSCIVSEIFMAWSWTLGYGLLTLRIYCSICTSLKSTDIILPLTVWVCLRSLLHSELRKKQDGIDRNWY